MIVAEHHVAEFVGIPYVPRGRTHDGCDCWGLMLMAAHDLYGIELPEYFYEEAKILEHACECIGREIAGPHWLPVDPPFRPGLVHIFRIKGYTTHCGLHLAGTYFLHSLPGRNSCVESLHDINWSQRRVGSYAWSP